MTKTKRTKPHMPAGFTLIELIVSLVLSIVVITWVYSYCSSHHKSHHTQTLVNEMNQNVRVAMNKIVTGIRMAGFKTGGVASNLCTNTAVWTASVVPSAPYTVSMDGTIVITDGGSSPDMITFLYGDVNPTTLSSAASIDDLNISLTMSASEVSETFHTGQIIYIGFGNTQGPDLEYAIIRSVNDQTLGIDTDPNTPSIQEGLEYSHRAGTEVGTVNCVTYAIFTDLNDASFSNHNQGHPTLKRKLNTGGMIEMAENIESLMVTAVDSENFQIDLRARTSQEDPGYEHPDFGDHYRRRTLSSVVKIRNL